MGSRQPKLRYVALATTNRTKTVLYTNLLFYRSKKFLTSSNQFILFRDEIYMMRSEFM
jgi:hypothetical protein